MHRDVLLNGTFSMSNIGFLSGDLMFQSRISGAAKAAGHTLSVNRQLEKLLEKLASLEGAVGGIIVDLTLTGLDLGLIATTVRDKLPTVKLVAYGPHVQEGPLQKATDAGFDLVLTRGQFDRDLASIMQQLT